MNEENPLNDIPMRVDAFKLESKGKTRYVYWRSFKPIDL